jgi:hypothetical protein
VLPCQFLGVPLRTRVKTILCGFSPHVQSNKAVNTTGTDVPTNLPNPVTMHEGLVIKGNVFINRYPDPKRRMSLGLPAVCEKSGLPCDSTIVSTA